MSDDDQPNFLAIPRRQGIKRRSRRRYWFLQYRQGRLDRMIERHHKLLIHTNIHLKYKEGYRFTVERRRVNNKTYSYLYRQKGRDKSQNREHTYLRSKDLLDYRNRVLFEQAKDEMYKKVGIRRVTADLTPSERRTLDSIFRVYEQYVLAKRMLKRRKRNPIIERYRKRLGLQLINQSRWYRVSRYCSTDAQEKSLKGSKAHVYVSSRQNRRSGPILVEKGSS